MSASRKSIRCALRAAFEQTAPPSLRKPRLTQAGTGPQRYKNQGDIASVTFKPLQGALLCGSPSILAWTALVIDRAYKPVLASTLLNPLQDVTA